MFSDVKVRTAGRRVLLFTNEDEPHASDDDAKKQAVTKAKDLREVGININLINMAKAGACSVHCAVPDRNKNLFFRRSSDQT